MTQEFANIVQRIKTIRKNKKRSIHDCASILDIPKERYLQFEQGEAALSLPQIEILSVFLGVPIQKIFDGNIPDEEFSSLMEGETKSKYLSLRHKIIQAKLSLERENADLNLQTLSDNTQIPLEDLQAYETGERIIPLHHLFSISEALRLPVDSFIDQTLLTSDQNNRQKDQLEWEPEFPKETQEAVSDGDQLYDQLLQAIKMIPTEDLARIAKILLNSLKSL